MYYLRHTLLLHESEQIEYVGHGPIESAIISRSHGNGADEQEIAAWSPYHFVGVVTGQDGDDSWRTYAISAEPLPHTLTQAELPQVERHCDPQAIPEPARY